MSARALLSLIAIPLVLSLYPSCAKRETSSAPHATIVTRDGNHYSGTVTSSSATQITLTGDDNAAHTLPMTDVKSINYDDAPAQAAAPPAAAPGTTPAAPPPPPDMSHEEHYHPAESAIRTKTYVLAAGTRVPVRVEETIDSGRAAEGQTYAAEVTRDLTDANGDVVVPRGANAQVVIRSASKGGRFRGTSDLVLDLASVSIEGRQYQLDTADVTERGRAGIGKNRRTAEFTGGGAAIGAIIGAIAGGGKGAAIGAGSGAGAGALTQILTKGGAIRVPAESVLTFQLDQPLRVTAAQ